MVSLAPLGTMPLALSLSMQSAQVHGAHSLSGVWSEGSATGIPPALPYVSGIDVVLAVRGQIRGGNWASGEAFEAEESHAEVLIILGGCELYKLSSARPLGDVCSSIARHLSEQ